MLVLKARAVDAVGDLLRESGELLPLACDDTALYVYNPLRVIDALDEDHSELVRFGSGRVMTIARHDFVADKLLNANIFKIPQMLRGSFYATNEVVSAIEEAGLQGTLFEKVWTKVS
ncbi:MAG: DUF1629 domain-containing protein [Ilumatobacteraceae bacterium]